LASFNYLFSLIFRILNSKRWLKFLKDFTLIYGFIFDKWYSLSGKLSMSSKIRGMEGHWDVIARGYVKRRTGHSAGTAHTVLRFQQRVVRLLNHPSNEPHIVAIACAAYRMRLLPFYQEACRFGHPRLRTGHLVLKEVMRMTTPEIVKSARIQRLQLAAERIVEEEYRGFRRF